MAGKNEKSDSIMSQAFKKLASVPSKAVEVYKKPTPAKWQKIGLALDDLSKIASGASIIAGNPYLAFGALLIGWIGRQLTNFAS